MAYGRVFVDMGALLVLCGGQTLLAHFGLPFYVCQGGMEAAFLE